MEGYLMDAWEPTLNDLREYYQQYFTLGCLSTDISNKFALISLICFLTKQARVKTPTATCEQVIRKIVGDSDSNSKGLLRALSVICEDFMRNTTEFMTFGFKSSKDIVAKIKEILNTELPFENPYPPITESPF